MSDYSELNKKFGDECVQHAVSIAMDEMENWPEPYHTSRATFLPHTWVVASICEALNRAYKAGMEDSVGY